MGFSPAQISILQVLAKLDVKQSCYVATTANITLSGIQTIDGLSVPGGSRVLVKNQTDPIENGIYVAAAGAWSRSTDADEDAEVQSGLFVYIQAGTLQGETQWYLSTLDPIFIGVTGLIFSQFSSGTGSIIAGNGLVFSGVVLDVVADADGSIVSDPDSIKVGVLATDAQHGNRGNGSQHTVADGSNNGFMSSADFTKLAGILTSTPPVNVTKSSAVVGVATTAARADHKHDITTAAASSVGIANAEGSSSGIARADHIHDHGAQTLGTHHAAVIPSSTSGFMTGADKAKLDVSAKSYLQWGNNSINASTTTRFLTPGYGDSVAQTTTIQQTIPTDGTLRNLKIKHNNVAGNGNSIVYTVRINGIDTGIAVTLASTSSDGSDVVNTAAVVAGDKIDIKVTKAVSIAGSPSDITASLEVRA